MATDRALGILPPDVLIEEETMPDYDARRFYPANLGDILHGRYKILIKLGWDSSSTVWLGKDTSRWRWQPDRYVALKISVANGKDTANHEVVISRRLGSNPAHEGFRFVRCVIDHFEIAGPRGAHNCLVYEPMRVTMTLFQRRLPDGKIPGPLLKHYIRHLLLGLDYIHRECGVIHTDIKQDNIMMGFEDPSVVEDYIRTKGKAAMPRKVQKDRSIYFSQYDFGPLKSFRMLLKLSNFGLAQRGDGPEPLRHPIQPPLFQAPEVILGAPWSYSADIWNLGVLIWNFLENRDLFRDIRSSQGNYDSRKHLAEMVALLGPPPRELIGREARWSTFYGGPFFNSEGNFLYGDLVPPSLKLPDSVLSLEGEDRTLFLDFVGHMLQWLPENRKSARDLLSHVWLTP
ncbi:CMGC protein kinase [Pleurostoma richardsiae]|uniref:non-specific serine/threonine protein kinase n=1 Tax=Pleurostoma richardsiae TaxID=41990 RepID=A0AA38VYT3_9PEZI|nr:CMGC protein kinase [Pleurostoma richardsiae]